jgi:hypothetical protein
MLPEVVGALDDCRAAIAAAAACQPPLDHDAAGILVSQRAMWEIVRQQILPAWERLVLLDRREGIERIAKRELRQFTCRTGCERQRSARGSARLRPADRRGRPIDAHRRVPKSAGRRPQHLPATAGPARNCWRRCPQLLALPATAGANRCRPPATKLLREPTRIGSREDERASRRTQRQMSCLAVISHRQRRRQALRPHDRQEKTQVQDEEDHA